ncbi:uncharacterized protein EI90DRAFT_2931653, partial [Cantharellus anzutake]|uniref:uncharacterized protein n=1 Tax=Cantharellus anzutake TaxID=1750568 RepID=UPI001908DAA7
RPPIADATVPITLYHHIFGKFQDDCKTYTPTKEDHDFASKFSHSMSAFFGNEDARAQTARNHFSDYKLDFLPTKIKSYCTDGDLRYKNLCYALLEVKQELSTGGADPLFEAAWYYNALTRDHSVDKTRSCLPCFILYLAGAHIGFAGALWTVYPHVQVLAPTLPLFYHASDVNMHMQTARFLGATRKAIFALNHYYKSELPQITVNPTVNFLYPTDFISLDSGENCAFEYLSWLDHKRLLFSGTAGDKKIFIKFTHRYSKDAHLKCVALKCAPALEGFQDIPGGWHMVVMGLIGDDYHELRCSDMKASFKSEIERKVTDLHQNEFVHGDIRTTNIMVRKDGKPGILLVNFDWAGKIGEVRYPMNVNDVEIKRPEGASDDQLIKAEHDIAMIGYMFE